MSQSIIQLVDKLPTGGVTVSVLRSLDFVVPGEWNNLTGFEKTVREVTGKHKQEAIRKISDRALRLYNDESEGYQQAIWLYQIADSADAAIGAAAIANKLSENISFLGFLNKLTPKADTLQSVDLCMKVVVELMAYCILNRIPIYNLVDFVRALPSYHNEALMRMAALVCLDGLIPLGPDFIQIAGTAIAGLNPAKLEQNPLFQKIGNLIPGSNSQGKLSFITQSFNAATGWMGNFVAARQLKPQVIVANLQKFVNVADDRLDYVAAFLDASTNYYEHTGIQTVARYLVKRSALEVK